MLRAIAICVVVAALPAGCDSSPAGVAPARPVGAPWFTDVGADSGIDFIHDVGATGEFRFPEITGSGCGFLDYDGDGDLDVFAVQAAGDGASHFYRNDAGRFTDVTAFTNVVQSGYGMGCSAADYDNDGDTDLFLTSYGPDVLSRNDGNGTFTDVTAKAFGGPLPERWSTSSAFFDYDRDGNLDLFVAAYVEYSDADNKACHGPSGRRDYCGPQSYEPMPDRLYRNQGDGTFTDSTRAAGIDRADGSGLGVAVADFDLDGWPDLFVANDGNANQLWMNRRDGTFEDTALLAGAAYNAAGQAEAGMGVTAADCDLDGDEDVFVTHLVGEHNTLWVNDGTGNFEDRTEAHRLAAPSFPYTGFGTLWADLDNDGFLDLFVANGGVKIVEADAGEPWPFGNPDQLFVNAGAPAFTFDDRSRDGGPAVSAVETSRAAAFGDYDDDGDVDILVSHSNGPLRLLRNDLGNRASWITLKLTGTTSNRDAIGALVTLERPGPPERPALLRRVGSDGSYLAANDLRVHFGLGADEGPQSVTVSWPSGRAERFTRLAARLMHSLREGDGEAVP